MWSHQNQISNLVHQNFQNKIKDLLKNIYITTEHFISSQQNLMNLHLHGNTFLVNKLSIFSEDFKLRVKIVAAL